ncbi:MAG: hypothetical protein RLZZ271_73 [Pseudomonadota bacterium]|jgi:hypothetical protein
MRWLLVMVIALIVFNWAVPWLQKYGLGRLPGDLKIQINKRVIYVPITTTLVLSFLVTLIGKII